MKKLLLAFACILSLTKSTLGQTCAFDRQISTSDSVLCAGDSTSLTFQGSVLLTDTVVPTPIVNNNGQDGNMFDITATNTIRITYFEGNIANTPNVFTDYYVYYKVGTHVGFENNSAAWTLIAGPVTFSPNAPNALTTIPIPVNVIIPAGQTYAFYLTNTSAISNNNRYHNGTATGNVLSTNSDLTVYEGTGGAFPFGTFFNARPWEGIVHYDFPDPTYLWNTGATTQSITVQPGTTTPYSCIGAYVTGCTVEDTISVTVNPLPLVALGNDTAFCTGGVAILDAGNPGATFSWCSGATTQTVNASTGGAYCVTVIDANGCVDSDTISVTVNSQPFIAALGDTICEGSTGTMFATGSAFLFNWNPGSLSGNVVTDSPSSTTTYTIVGTDGNGCMDTTTAEMYVHTAQVISISSFGTYCLDDNTIALMGPSPLGGTYSGTGVSSDSLYPSVAGAGTFMITYTVADSNGCVGSDSATVTIDLCLGIGTGEQVGNVSVYPNPMNESAMIQIDNSIILVDAQLSLYDVNGALVRNIPSISTHVVTLERDGLAIGVYFFTLTNNGGELTTGKLIVE